ncbi:hypothetical protein JCM10213_004149 [Rhodosporidiobolus nylandii]
MSFSVLPPELKEWTALLVQVQDERYRRVRGDARKTSEDWYGRGLLALSQVDKQMRELVLPIRYSVSRAFLPWLPVSAEQIIPQSFNLARLPFEQLESWSTSDAAQGCRTLYLGQPVIYEYPHNYSIPRPAWRDYAEQEGFQPSNPCERWRAVRLAFSYLDRLPLLRHISFDTDEWYDKRQLFHSNPGGIRNVAGVPALAKRITSWSFGRLSGSEAASLLTLDRDSPQTVSVSMTCGGYIGGERDLFEALRACKSLKRLELKIWDSDRMYDSLFDSLQTPGRPAFAALRHLTLKLRNVFNDSVFPFLTSLPALVVLELNAREADSDWYGKPATPASVAKQLPFRPSPPAVLPSLTSFRLERGTFLCALTTLSEIEAANLQSATLVFYRWSEVESAAETYSVSPSLISSIETQNPLLRSLTLASGDGPLDPILHQINDFASTLSASNISLFVQSPSGREAFPSSRPVPAPHPSELSRPPVDEAKEVLKWAAAELEKAERIGDDGAARLLRDSLKGVIELQDRIAEGYASSRSALL